MDQFIEKLLVNGLRFTVILLFELAQVSLNDKVPVFLFLFLAQTGMFAC